MPDQDQHTAAGRSRQILLVEGDQVSHTHIRELLTRSGYQFVVAKDGVEALHLLQSGNPPSLAVLQCRLPGLDAEDICRQISGSPHRKQIYVIVLVPWHQQKERTQALAAGADECIYQPVDVRELRTRLEIGSQILLERALRESEERFRSAFDCAGIGMAVLTVSGEFIQVNRALCKLLDYPPEELLRKNLGSVSHPEDVPNCTVLLRELLHGPVNTGEFGRRFITRNGATVWTAFALSSVRNADQTPTHFVAQFKDITRRKAAEEALSRSQALSRAITDNVNDLIIVRDLQYRCLYASRSYLEHLGYSSTELQGSDSLQVLHPDDVEAARNAISQVRQDHQPRSLKVRLRHKNGSTRHVESIISLLRNSDGTAEGFVTVSRLIDERILAERRLQEAHDETELFLESIPSILIGLDHQGNVTRWNRTASQVLGLSRDEAIGRAFVHCGIKWLHPEMELELNRWLQTESMYRCENLAYEREGKIRFLGLSVRRIPSQANDAPRFLVTGADVTERKNLEGQLRQAQKLEAIGQLAAGIAHEINTPTQYVGDNTRFLKDSWGAIAKILALCRTIQQHREKGTVPEEVLGELGSLIEESDLEYLLAEIPRAIDQSLDGVQRVAKIVTGMKEFSHPGTEEKRAIDINKAIETTITVARHEWKYVADVSTGFDKALPLIPCLIGEFNQVILNLIVNASHAIAAAVAEGRMTKGNITITTRREEPWAEIAVRDDGGGIAEDIRSRIFEPFFTTKEVGKGTGQGLALAHSVIVNRHQGQIWFESEMGKGTTFFLRLPLQAAAPTP